MSTKPSGTPILNILSGKPIKGIPANNQVLQYNATLDVFEWVDPSVVGAAFSSFYSSQIVSVGFGSPTNLSIHLSSGSSTIEDVQSPVPKNATYSNFKLNLFGVTGTIGTLAVKLFLDGLPTVIEFLIPFNQVDAIIPPSGPTSIAVNEDQKISWEVTEAGSSDVIVAFASMSFTIEE